MWNIRESFLVGIRKSMKKITFLAFLWIAFLPLEVLSENGQWKKADEGLFVVEFESPQKGKVGDSKITIVKIAPTFYSFKLLCASEREKVGMAAKEWAKKYGLISAINAGMYQADGMTNVGYMKNFSHVNNPRMNATYNAVLAFNPVDLIVPEIQIIDRKCQDLDRLRPKYNTLVQNIRMISCQQENVWSRQDKKWSMVVLGIDRSGNVLFIFTRVPYSGHDFANVLLGLPIHIYNAMYLEGGPEASLYFSGGGVEFERVGSYETGFNENEFNLSALPVPNVIGIVKKSK